MHWTPPHASRSNTVETRFSTPAKRVSHHDDHSDRDDPADKLEASTIPHNQGVEVPPGELDEIDKALRLWSQPVVQHRNHPNEPRPEAGFETPH